jgi:anti-sigma-K factor RskA
MADDLDLIAAEYALGLLDTDEKRDFVRRLQREPLAVAAVADWQERLAPLTSTLAPIEPPLGLLERIQQEIDGPSSLPVPANQNDRAPAWRWTAIAAALVAVVMAGVAFTPRIVQPPTTVQTPPPAIQPVAFNQIAALSPQGGTPGLFVSFDKATGKMRVVPVNLTPNPGKSFELWMIRGKNAPESMGLINIAHVGTPGVKTTPTGDVTMAVSVEPTGGSPTGQPTGPVVYSGKLVTVPTA